MSRENVELAQQVYEAVNRRDQATVLRLAHPDVEMFPLVAALSGETYRGHVGVSAWFADLVQGFESFQVERDQVEDLGQWTLTVGTAHAVGRESNVTIQRPFAQLIRWEEGCFVWVRSYSTRQDALEAVGLRE